MINVILDILSNKNNKNNDYNFSLFRTTSPRLLAVKNLSNAAFTFAICLKCKQKLTEQFRRNFFSQQNLDSILSST